MNSLTADDYKQDAVVPPANFKIWPMTRIGAITIDIVIFIVVLLLWFIPRKVYRTEHLDDTNSVQRYVSFLFSIDWIPFSLDLRFLCVFFMRSVFVGIGYLYFSNLLSYKACLQNVSLLNILSKNISHTIWCQHHWHFVFTFNIQWYLLLVVFVGLCEWRLASLAHSWFKYSEVCSLKSKIWQKALETKVYMEVTLPIHFQS